MLCDTKGTLSSDRLKRVQGCTESSAKRIKRSLTSENISKIEQLRIGEWAIFILDDEGELEGEQEKEQSFMKNCLIGIVVGFKFVTKIKKI